jgi:hypothetical protein
MECEKRTTSRVLDNLSSKLGTLPRRHPDRPQLIRMMIDIHREIERPKSNLFPTATDRCCAKTKLVEAADLWVATQEALVAAMQGCKETEAEQEAADIAGSRLVTAVMRWRSSQH